MKVEERLLKYVGYHTTSDEASDKIPSSDREFALARELESELKELGLSKVVLTDHCYVYGLLPATAGMEHKKAVGFIAHMDTAPDFSGENVKPQLLRHYDGSDVLLRGSGEYLRVSDFPELKALSGRTLITTDGTTLLGADDKAGVAEIMTALERLSQRALLTAISGLDLHPMKRSERVRICLIWTISRQILPTPWTVITRARWPMKTLMPQALNLP